MLFRGLAILAKRFLVVSSYIRERISLDAQIRGDLSGVSSRVASAVEITLYFLALVGFLFPLSFAFKASLLIYTTSLFFLEGVLRYGSISKGDLPRLVYPAVLAVATLLFPVEQTFLVIYSIRYFLMTFRLVNMSYSDPTSPSEDQTVIAKIVHQLVEVHTWLMDIGLLASLGLFLYSAPLLTLSAEAGLSILFLSIYALRDSGALDSSVNQSLKTLQLYAFCIEFISMVSWRFLLIAKGIQQLFLFVTYGGVVSQVFYGDVNVDKEESTFVDRFKATMFSVKMAEGKNEHWPKTHRLTRHLLMGTAFEFGVTDKKEDVKTTLRRLIPKLSDNLPADYQVVTKKESKKGTFEVIRDKGAILSDIVSISKRIVQREGDMAPYDGVDELEAFLSKGLLKTEWLLEKWIAEEDSKAKAQLRRKLDKCIKTLIYEIGLCPAGVHYNYREEFSDDSINPSYLSDIERIKADDLERYYQELVNYEDPESWSDWLLNIGKKPRKKADGANAFIQYQRVLNAVSSGSDDDLHKLHDFIGLVMGVRTHLHVAAECDTGSLTSDPIARMLLDIFEPLYAIQLLQKNDVMRYLNAVSEKSMEDLFLKRRDRLEGLTTKDLRDLYQSCCLNNEIVHKDIERIENFNGDNSYEIAEHLYMYWKPLLFKTLLFIELEEIGYIATANNMTLPSREEYMKTLFGFEDINWATSHIYNAVMEVGSIAVAISATSAKVLGLQSAASDKTFDFYDILPDDAIGGKENRKVCSP